MNPNFHETGDKTRSRSFIRNGIARDQLLAKSGESSSSNPGETRKSRGFSDPRHTETWEEVSCHSELWHRHRCECFHIVCPFILCACTCYTLFCTKAFACKYLRTRASTRLLAPTHTHTHTHRNNPLNMEVTHECGDHGSTVVKVLCYKSEGLWFNSRWCLWNFLLT